MTQRYVIMANGHGIRWGNHLDIPKQLISIEGRTLLERIVAQVRSRDPHAEIIISSGNPRFETPGAIRHEPLRNEIELDRFPPELVTAETCFLYGDTFYANEAMDIIVSTASAQVTFVRTESRIVAVRTGSVDHFLNALIELRDRFLSGMISRCRGWELMEQMMARGTAVEQILTESETRDFNAPEDLDAFWMERTTAEMELQFAHEGEAELAATTGDGLVVAEPSS